MSPVQNGQQFQGVGNVTIPEEQEGEEMTIDEFKNRMDRFKADEARIKKQVDNIGNLRLAAFLAGAAVTVFLLIKAGILPGILSLAVATGVFIFLVVRHGRLSYNMDRFGRLAEVNRMYVNRMQTDWVNFSDCGQEFTDDAHPYTGDLDIFGPKSLFQWLNTAHTHYGRNALCALLKNPDKSMGAVKRRQSAVKELSGMLDFCQELQCEGMLAKDTANDPAELLSYAENQTRRFRSDWIINLFYLLPASVVLTFVLFFLGAPIPLFVPLLILSAQMLVFAVGFKKNSFIINNVYGLRKNLGAFGNLMRRIEKEEFRDEYLSELKQELFSNNEPASASLKKLESVANAIDVKFSTVLYFLLNFCLLWDYHCVFALEEWKKQYGKQIRRWLETIGQIEALTSLSVPGRMYPGWAFPVFSDKGLEFAAAELGHPLISKEVCVRNDFEINSRACVITGSNMSGKTTLLRTVGINLVLAYSGAQVFAGRLDCSIMDIFTSMRIRDDLNGGISTFYAELLRIKTIIDYSHKETPMIYLIDEIFMGTNSLDRIAGARSVLKNLSKSWIIGLISTHDFELCDLENDSKASIKNYHFTETYRNNEIKFDYKLRSGRSMTTNARYLMKMVGIELME
jgi:hypothetical protein